MDVSLWILNEKITIWRVWYSKLRILNIKLSPLLTKVNVDVLIFSLLIDFERWEVKQCNFKYLFYDISLSILI